MEDSFTTCPKNGLDLLVFEQKMATWGEEVYITRARPGQTGEAESQPEPGRVK